MNCGCGRPHDRRGKPANITIEDLEHAADANGQSLRETVDHISAAMATLPPAERAADSGDRDTDGLAHPAGDEPLRSAARGSPQTES